MQWAEGKAKVWGLAVPTITQWLETKEKLVPDLLEEAKKRGEASLTHYREIAHSLPSRPELQKPLAEKIAREDLTTAQIRTVAQALKRAEDNDEVRSILRQPVSRTEDQMVREAVVKTTAEAFDHLKRYAKREIKLHERLQAKAFIAVGNRYQLPAGSPLIQAIQGMVPAIEQLEEAITHSEPPAAPQLPAPP